MNGAVVGVDRDYRETCSACLENSQAVPGAKLMVAMASLNTYAEITSFADMSRPISQLLSILKQINNGYSVAVYIGFDNGDFYSVLNCGSSVHNSTDNCKQASTPYIAGIKNSRVLSADYRKYYSLTSDGVMGSVVLNNATAAYNTTQRTWYTTRNGFTDVYTFASTGLPGRSYVSGFIGGVASADYTDSEPCVVSRSVVVSGGNSLWVNSGLLIVLMISVLSLVL